MRRHVHPYGVAQKNTVAILALFVFGLTAASYAEDQYVRQREKLVNYLTKPLWGRTPVRDKAVLDAMRAVPRHEFVPQLAHLAYEDRPLPIGLKQTISQPYIVAIMSEALEPKAGHKILEIGTGSGYQAAVLAEIVDSVYTIEIVPELGKRAAEVLQRLEYRNVYTSIGDGYKGWKEHAPYDGIIVTAAPDHVPQPLVDQLKAGGRMVIPVGPEGRVQQLVLIEKADDGSVRRRVLDDVRFVPLTREDETN